MGSNAIEKSLQVIENLANYPHGLSLLELSEILGFPKSTTHRILNILVAYDYASQNPKNKKYSLGFKFLSIGRIIIENLDVRRIAHDHLHKLHEKVHETVHLAILRDSKVVYIDKIESPRGLSLATYIGFRTDPHAAAGGKILLSGLPPEQVRKMYKNRSLKAYGKNTITNMAYLLDEVENIKKQGYAIDNEEYYEGVRCVAAPIRAGGEIVAAVSITGSIFTMTMERIKQELTELVTQTAQEISSAMKW